MPYARRLMPLILGVGMALGLAVYPAHAVSTWTLPPFSLESSDGTDPALLDATWTYSYDYGLQTFDITIVNGTVNPPAAFNISELYWNMNDLYFDAISYSGSYDLFDTTDPGNKTKADGFGVFDFKLDLKNNGIPAGNTQTFGFGVTNGADVSAYTLFDEFAGGIPWRWAALKFTGGVADDPSVLEEDDDSAFATPTPEPCTLGLLLCAAPALFAITRRKRQKA